MKIMQGDEYDIYINLKQDGEVLKPEWVDNIELCIGSNIRKTSSGESLLFDREEGKWYTRLRQNETLAMPCGENAAFGRVKYKGAPESDVVGFRLESIFVLPTTSREVL